MTLAGNIGAGTPDEVQMTRVHSRRARRLSRARLRTTGEFLDNRDGQDGPSPFSITL
jgi:hypothetical protein